MSEEAAPKKEKIEIHYMTPRFHRRVFANLVDIIIFVLVFLCLFLGARAIVTNDSRYVSKEDEIVLAMKESGLYHVDDDGTTTDIVSYYKNGDFSGSEKKEGAVQAISTFFGYADAKCEASVAAEIRDSYDAYRLDGSLAYEGVAYFIEDSSGIIENPECAANDEAYFTEAYAPYIDDYLQGYLVTRIPGYVELSRYEAKCLILYEILPSYGITGILVYLIPPLCFRRGRYTLGKALYHIGVADSRLLALSYPRTIARWAIFYFAELWLSLVTFGIPFIISFSMMAFTKKKQGFPDYMLGLLEVDLSHAKLYKSYDEIRMSRLSFDKEAPDFRMERGE
jgi:hypothetical protein